MKNPVKEFEHALLIEKVASRYCQAMEFDNDEALKKYLKEHPGADKSRHTVKKKEEKEIPKKEQTEAADREHQKSEAYKTEKKEGYYPQKAPEGMKYPKELDLLPKDLQEHVSSMFEEDLDANKCYKHPAIIKLQKIILNRLEAGDKDKVRNEFVRLEDLKDEMSRKKRHSKSDAEADPYRFALRKLYHAWQAYSVAFGETHIDPYPRE